MASLDQAELQRDYLVQLSYLLLVSKRRKRRAKRRLKFFTVIFYSFRMNIATAIPSSKRTFELDRFLKEA
jgi:hypothetical protein